MIGLSKHNSGGVLAALLLAPLTAFSALAQHRFRLGLHAQFSGRKRH